MTKIISYVAGSHGNYLAYVLNVLHNKSQPLQILGKAFDTMQYPEQFDKIYRASQEDHSGEIGIIVDDEILWLHQFLCRARDNNFDIHYVENNFFEIAMEKNTRLKEVVGELIKVNKRHYPSYDKNTLGWFYKNKIFGILLRNEPSQYQKNIENYTHKIPFTSFYSLGAFERQISSIIPNYDHWTLEKLYQQFLSNIKNTRESITKNDSILYKSWQEYMVDRKS